MQKTKKVIFLVVLFFISLKNFAQSTNFKDYSQGFEPLPPHAAQMFMFQNYPVNHASGLVEIKIPLYEIEYGDIKIPIYIEYHSSGIKVQSPFSPVGAGWSLSAEPSISRSVQGKPDEESYYGSSSEALSFMDGYTFYSWLNNNTIDLMPDRFAYKLNDKSGNFFIGHQNHIDTNDRFIVHPYEPISIETEYDEIYKKFKSFNITDEKGLKYTFEEADQIITENNHYYYSDWKCTNIYSPKINDRVSFIYSELIPHSELLPNDYVSIIQPNKNLYSDFDPLELVETDTGGQFKPAAAFIYNSFNGNKTVMFTDGTTTVHEEERGLDTWYRYASNQLTEIDFGNFKLNFVTKTIGLNYYMLDKIIVSDKNNAVIKTINFYTSRLGTSPDRTYKSNIEYLYKLDSIKTGVNSFSETYKFDYNNPDNFPSRYSRNVDYWGYCSGETNFDVSMVPHQQISLFQFDNINSKNYKTIQIGSSCRKANANYTKYGSLNKITYPTGGYTTFEYEPNHYTYWFSMDGSINIGSGFGYWDDIDGGGLRIKSIKEYEKNDVLSTTKDYVYYTGNCKNPPLQYHNDNSSQLKNFFSKKTTFINNGTYKDNTTFYANSLVDLNSFHGTPITYRHVDEIVNDKIKTSYYYNYNNEVSYDDIRVNNWNDWWTGKLDSIVSYKFVNNTFTPVHKKEIYYNTYNEAYYETYIPKDDYKYNNYKLGLPYDYSYLKSVITTGCYKVVKEKEMNIFDNKTVVTKTNYEYEDSSGINKCSLCYPLIIDKEKKDNNIVEDDDFFDKEVLREEYSYPLTIKQTGTDEIARNNFISRGAIATLLQKKTLTGNYKIEYNENAGEFTFNQPNTSVSYEKNEYNQANNNSFPLLSKVVAGIDEANATMRYEVLRYDSKSNPQHIKMYDNQEVVFIWSYDYQYLIAEVKNATYTDVKAALGYTDLQMDALSANLNPDVAAVRVQLNTYFQNKLAQITSYTYKPLVGLLTKTDPRGIISYYEYNNLYRLQCIKDKDGNILQKFDYNYKE